MPKPNEHELKNRVLRIFISSTFRDMQAERDELLKFTFPELRRICQERGVTWGEVDLRWGITDELVAEGQVLPICLEEISRCRPYFIGILGERYGYVMDEINPELCRQEPWLEAQTGHSITEMEILHGVLNNPDLAEHAFFYFRDPDYVRSLPAGLQSDFIEGPYPEEIEKYSPDEVTRRVVARKRKLEALKSRIRNSGLPFREGFQDSEELGDWVLEDFREVIDRDFPEGSRPDNVIREAADHYSYAERLTRAYVGGENYFTKLDNHLREGTQPLVVLGESGLGKSALLAKWALDHQAANPSDVVIMHFIGSTRASADWVEMLRRIMGELKQSLDIRDEIPTRPEDLSTALNNLLHKAAAQKRIILILDGLNQLDDHDGAQGLFWLPESIPANVHIYLSTLPGKPLDEITKRQWPTMLVKPLDHDERKELIQKYLKLFSKALSTPRIERIADAVQCGNPLFLKVLLDELRLFGRHELLDYLIDDYLDAENVPALYNRILARCERDYERYWPGLVGQAMCVIWAAKRGVSEKELREILGSEDDPLPHAYWSPLFLALEQSLINRSGILNFAHDYLRQAVQQRYLADEGNQTLMHERMAHYFDPMRYISIRSIDELPWQYASAKNWLGLFELMTDFQFVEGLVREDVYQAVESWRLLEENTSVDIGTAYQSVVDAPENYILSAYDIARLLEHAGRISAAAEIHSFLVERYRQSGNRLRLSPSLAALAGIRYRLGQLDEAWDLNIESRELAEEMGDQSGAAQAIIGLADIAYIRGDFDEAGRLTAEAGEVFVEIGDYTGETSATMGLARILYTQGHFDQALELYKECEQRSRQTGNMVGVALSLGNQADIHIQKGDLDRAMQILAEEEELCTDLGDQALLAAAIGGVARILLAREEYEAAFNKYQTCEKLFRDLGDPGSVAIAISHQADIMSRRGYYEQALGLAEEAYGLVHQYQITALYPQLEDQLNRIRAMA
jgi:tetratricopeptide (TPR) repeat protein